MVQGPHLARAKVGVWVVATRSCTDVVLPVATGVERAHGIDERGITDLGAMLNVQVDAVQNG